MKLRRWRLGQGEHEAISRWPFRRPIETQVSATPFRPSAEEQHRRQPPEVAPVAGWPTTVRFEQAADVHVHAPPPLNTMLEKAQGALRSCGSGSDPYPTGPRDASDDAYRDADAQEANACADPSGDTRTTTTAIAGATGGAMEVGARSVGQPSVPLPKTSDRLPGVEPAHQGHGRNRRSRNQEGKGKRERGEGAVPVAPLPAPPVLNPNF